jgi:hypothetical protein
MKRTLIPIAALILFGLAAPLAMAQDLPAPKQAHVGGDPFLSEVVIVNLTGQKIVVWVRATTLQGHLVDIPVSVHSKYLGAYPSLSSSWPLLDKIEIGAFDGRQSAHAEAKFNGGASKRRYVIEYKADTLRIVEK